MKVAHVECGRHLYGGARQVLWLCRGLNNHGVDSVLLCEPGSEVERAAREQKISVVPLHCGGDLDLSYRYRLQRVLEAASVDIVHSHSRRGADIFAGRAAAAAGIPAIVSRRVDHREWPIAANLRYRGYQRIVAISDNIASVLRASGVTDQRLVTIRSAVDCPDHNGTSDAWRHQFGLEATQVVGVVAAQLIARKGHRFLFEILPALCRRFPEFRLLIFGKGPLESQLMRLAAKLGVAERVTFCGFDANLPEFLHGADLLIHPALKEGLGVAMLNAAASGLPVVAFDVAGAREAVLHEQTGILVPPADGAALLDAIARLIDNPDQRLAMGQAGRRRVTTEFSTEQMTRKHIEMYRAVLNER